MLDELDQAAATLGGNWAKLRTAADPTIEGRVLAFEKRPKTFEGEVVLNRKTKEPRIEWVFTLQVQGEPDPVKLSLNESGQRAVAEALRQAGAKPETGDVLKIGVKSDPESDRDQATYQAKWTKNAAPLDIPAADDEPF